jgi:hypothetical protein
VSKAFRVVEYGYDRRRHAEDLGVFRGVGTASLLKGGYACITGWVLPLIGQHYIGRGDPADSVTPSLETRFETPDGVVSLIDCMGRRDGCADLVRLVGGEHGRVQLRMELVIRCEYGSIIPWVRRLEDGRHAAVAGTERLTLATPIETHALANLFMARRHLLRGLGA